MGPLCEFVDSGGGVFDRDVTEFHPKSAKFSRKERKEGLGLRRLPRRGMGDGSYSHDIISHGCWYSKSRG